MEINYPVAGLIILAVIALVIFIIKKNKKDEQQYEKEIIQSELKPEKDDNDKAEMS